MSSGLLLERSPLRPVAGTRPRPGRWWHKRFVVARPPFAGSPCGCGTSLVHFRHDARHERNDRDPPRSPRGRRCGRSAMRWQLGRRSDNIEDRRGMPVGRGAAVGGGIGTLVLVLLAMYFGVDPSVILQGTDPGDSRPAPSVQQRPGGDDQMRDFVSVVLADTEDTWRELFKQMGRQNQEPKLVLFSGA